MRPIPDHPEIEWALRTGYPSWMQESDHDVDDDWDDDRDDDDLEGYYND